MKYGVKGVTAVLKTILNAGERLLNQTTKNKNHKKYTRILILISLCNSLHLKVAKSRRQLNVVWV